MQHPCLGSRIKSPLVALVLTTIALHLCAAIYRHYFPIFLLRTYKCSNLASYTQTWSFTRAKEIFILTPHTVSRQHLQIPAAEPALLAAVVHSCKAGSRVVNMQGAASLCSYVWASRHSPGLHWKALALHVTVSCRFEL